MTRELHKISREGSGNYFPIRFVSRLSAALAFSVGRVPDAPVASSFKNAPASTVPSRVRASTRLDYFNQPELPNSAFDVHFTSTDASNLLAEIGSGQIRVGSLLRHSGKALHTS